MELGYTSPYIVSRLTHAWHNLQVLLYLSYEPINYIDLKIKIKSECVFKDKKNISSSITLINVMQIMYVNETEQ